MDSWIARREKLKEDAERKMQLVRNLRERGYLGEPLDYVENYCTGRKAYCERQLKAVRG